MVANGNQQSISHFAYRWTVLTTIIANVLCFPFIIGAKEIISAYVGSEYSNLSIWLIIWVISVLCQIHSTPTNALILAKGQTKVMVYISGIACVISMIINAVLTKHFGVGSAIIGYAVYIAINLTSYYFYYYKRTLHISIRSILYSFLYPTFWGIISFLVIYFVFHNTSFSLFNNERWNHFSLFLVKSIFWCLLYGISLLIFKVVRYSNKQVFTKFEA